MMSKELKAVICGAGAWGTAMALQLERKGILVSLLPRRPEHARKMQVARVNEDYLPGIALPDGIRIEESDNEALSHADLLFLGAPSYALRPWLQRIDESLAHGASPFLISLAKGLELETRKTPCEIVREAFPDNLVGCLSGPTFAGEVALGKPSAMTLAASRLDPIVNAAQLAISGPSMRIYLTEDLKGVELGGCLKNVYAIAAGCCQGLNLGDNALAALLTRALAEMVRVGVELGAKADTFYGLSGFGDLVATCHGDWSRNRTFGESIAKGRTAGEVIDSQKTAVEGYRTAKSFHSMLGKRGIDAPILEQVYLILHEGKLPLTALNDLMSRDLKREIA